MLEGTTVLIKDPSWGDYSIEVKLIDSDDEYYQVLDGNDKGVYGTWCTIEGATACVELIAGGHWKG